MFIADTHVHFYPCFDWAKILHTVANSYSAQLPEKSAQRFALCIVDKSDYDSFKFLSNLQSIDIFSIEPGQENGVISVKNSALSQFFILQGKQIVTAERLEILSLCNTAIIPDGLSAGETIQAINAKDGIAVVSWSPGKWTGKRAGIVRNLIETHSPNQFFLGDICMRAEGLPEPALFSLACKKGFSILAGSDPLPVHDEETLIGSYGIKTQDPDCQDSSLAYFRSLLRSNCINFGRRSSILHAAMRYSRYTFKKTFG